MGRLVSDGYSVLISPEGMQMGVGAVGSFKPGVAMIASRLRLPVVPVRLTGVGRGLPPNSRLPRPGPERICFGPPLTLIGDDYPALTRRVEDAVRKM